MVGPMASDRAKRNRWWALPTILMVASGCHYGVVGTVVTDPAHADPDQIAFGRGVSVSVGRNVSIADSATAVVVASDVDPRGPSDVDESDGLWRVRLGQLEFCHWSAGSADDCRVATYDESGGGYAGTFLPTLIEPANLARGWRLLVIGDRYAAAANVANAKPQPMPFVPDHAIWLTASAPALFGAQPVYLCTVQSELPACKPLPAVTTGIVGSMVVRKGTERTSVLWMHAAANQKMNFAGVVMPENVGVMRCEDQAGVPNCKIAKEEK